VTGVAEGIHEEHDKSRWRRAGTKACQPTEERTFLKHSLVVSGEEKKSKHCILDAIEVCICMCIMCARRGRVSFYGCSSFRSRG
jgi:hypothetical protein